VPSGAFAAFKEMKRKAFGKKAESVVEDIEEG
jgi:hypothetical protein